MKKIYDECPECENIGRWDYEKQTCVRCRFGLPDKDATVTHIAEVKNDNTLISPRETLEGVIRDIDSGEINPDKLMVIALRTKDNDGGDRRYGTRRYASNMHVSEMITLCEAIKSELVLVLNGRVD